MQLLVLRRRSKDSIITLPAPKGYSGVPEAPSGYPSSPPSPSGIRGGSQSPRRRNAKEASSAIAKECDRLLCGDMRRIFLGGRNASDVPRSMGSIHQTQSQKKINVRNQSHNYDSDFASDDEDDDDDDDDEDEVKYIEVWDYLGGTSFRGFIAPGRSEKTLFLFFEHVVGTQLKNGLMALIELATECFSCDRLVICVERNAEGLQGLVRDLGWVGFELITLAHWVQPSHSLPTSRRNSASFRSESFSSTSTISSVFSEDDVTSEKWLFMGMEL